MYLLYFDERFPPLTNISFQYEEGINEMYWIYNCIYVCFHSMLKFVAGKN